MSKRTIVIWVLVLAGLIHPMVVHAAQVKDEEGAMVKKEACGPVNGSAAFGVLEFLPWNHEWNHYKYSNYAELQRVVSLMKEAGVSIVRMDFIWQDIEPTQGAFDFDKYDALVDLLCENHIQILGLLLYSTDWASSAWNEPSRDSAFFINYAVTVATRYKDKVKYWEVWNEPDSRTYWTTQDGLKGYCALLKNVYGALKKINPEFLILNGGLANGIASVNRLYDNGAKDYFDILNIHIFESPLNRGSLKGVEAFARVTEKIMQRNGDGQKKLWVTEIGCPGVKPGIKTGNWWMGTNPTERQQAAWVTQIYRRLLAMPVVEKVFWAFFRDTQNHWNTGVDYFGLVRWDFSKKTAFSAYKREASRWRKAQEAKK